MGAERSDGSGQTRIFLEESAFHLLQDPLLIRREWLVVL
jgi:hypothetical protein